MLSRRRARDDSRRNLARTALTCGTQPLVGFTPFLYVAPSKKVARAFKGAEASGVLHVQSLATTVS